MQRLLSYMYALSALCCAVSCVLVVGCQRTVSPVPSSGRTVVPPQGTTDVVKPWNHPTRQEGDAILGPLSNERR